VIFDYIKYDWHPIDVEHTARMSRELRRVGRDIVFSLSNAAAIETAPSLAGLAQVWRTTGDISDMFNTSPNAKAWEHSIRDCGFTQDPWSPHSGPGHWNDPDMLVIGKLGWGKELRNTRLTPDEQYTHITLWCLLSSPLLLGCDLSQLDDFTLGLLTNDEVIAVDQDPLGRQARRVMQDGPAEVWAKDLEDGSKAVGLFNLSDSSVLKVTARRTDVGIAGAYAARDPWRQKDLGRFSNDFAAELPAHGSMLLKLTPEKKDRRN
jgi:alpha-galactosidase